MEGARLAYCLECEYYSEEVLDILLNFETSLTVLKIDKDSHLIYLKKNEEIIKDILSSNEDPSVNLGKALGYGYTQEDYWRPYDYYRIAFFLSDDSGGIYAFKIPAEKYRESHSQAAEKKLKEMNYVLKGYNLEATLAVEHVGTSE